MKRSSRRRSRHRAVAAKVRFRSVLGGCALAALAVACGDTVAPPAPPAEVEVRWSSVVAGSDFSCALTEEGAAYCWGSGDGGALGSPQLGNAVSPVAVAGGHRFISLAAGNQHVCGIRLDQATYCWGSWTLAGTPEANPRPMTVERPLVALAAATWSTCGLAADGTAYCWSGHPYDHAQYGMAAQPAPVPGNHRFTSVAAGAAHGNAFWCAVDEQGAAWCWGSGEYGTLGDGRYGGGHSSAQPVRVAGGLTFQSVSAGYIACGRTTAGAVYCWGPEVNYPPFQADIAGGATPAPLHGDIPFDVVAVGRRHACGLSAGRAYCWGYNMAGQLGDGSTASGSNTPVPVAGGLTFRTIAAGSSHSCGTTTDGHAYCWGNHGWGQLGDGSPIPPDKTAAHARVPVRVRVFRD